VPDDTDIVRRRNLVLDLLAEPERRYLTGNSVSLAEIEEAKEEPVVLASQRQENWFAPHFVWQVQDELARKLCGEDAQTCPELEDGGFRITTTIDLELQDMAERWVKLAARVPKADDPALAAQRLGFEELPEWVVNLTGKDLNNGALVALDYETGEIIAYVGSADWPTAGASRDRRSSRSTT
jgi:membrane peptidoglycan carboxypeptidase